MTSLDNRLAELLPKLHNNHQKMLMIFSYYPFNTIWKPLFSFRTIYLLLESGIHVYKVQNNVEESKCAD